MASSSDDRPIPTKGTPTGNPPEDVFGINDVLGEGLLAPGLARLFGRPFTGLTLGDFGANPASNNPLIQQLQNAAESTDPQKRPTLARIYGFSYLGNYYKLLEPAVYLVFGVATPVPPGFRVPELAMGILGAEQKVFDFTTGVFMWAADELDITLKIDIETGWLKDLLLEPAMSGDTNQSGDMRRPDLVGRAALVGNAALIQRDRSR